MKPLHPWIARLGVGLFMLILAFIGLIITDVRSKGGWNYWRWIVPIYAIVALWLSWYLRRRKHSLSPVTLWHELLHWIGLIVAVFLISFFVSEGLIGRFQAALAMLTLIALGVFLAGIYIETTFLFVGIFLGVFSLAIALIYEYLYAIAIPILLLTGVVMGWILWRQHKKLTSQR